jgi:hypothetical protein
MSGRSSPEELTAEDLDAAAHVMARYYFEPVLNGYLTCVFMNSGYVNATSKAATRAAYRDRVLFAHRRDSIENGTLGSTCAFSGRPATHLIDRGQLPLFTGEGVLNFVPAGRGGLPIAGPYLTALQALPLGGRRTEGRLLVAHADEPSLTLHFAKLYWDENRRLLNLLLNNQLPAESRPDSQLRAHLSYDKKESRHKMPDAKGWASLLLTDLTEAIAERRTHGRKVRSSLSVYWLSSSGQGPSLTIYHFPSNLLAFLESAGSATTAQQWNDIVIQGWRKNKDEPVGPGISRNSVFQDLAEIYESGGVDPAAAKRFLRRHVLRSSRSGPRWSLADLFLREVLLMTAKRIQSIRQFADGVFEYIEKMQYQKLANDLSYARNAHEFRTILVRAQRKAFGAEMTLPFGFDSYIDAFHAEDASGLNDWWLVRDLILIRLFERLHEAKMALPEDVRDREEDSEENAA